MLTLGRVSMKGSVRLLLHLKTLEQEIVCFISPFWANYPFNPALNCFDQFWSNEYSAQAIITLYPVTLANFLTEKKKIAHYLVSETSRRRLGWGGILTIPLGVAPSYLNDRWFLNSSWKLRSTTPTHPPSAPISTRRSRALQRDNQSPCTSL